jgi:hypothetical protein
MVGCGHRVARTLLLGRATWRVAGLESAMRRQHSAQCEAAAQLFRRARAQVQLAEAAAEICADGDGAARRCASHPRRHQPAPHAAAR